MILDAYENHGRYLSLNSGFSKAFDFLGRRDLAQLEPGRYDIDGKQVYATIARETGRKKEGAQLESHDTYIDIQMVISGKDEMGWSPLSGDLSISREYDESKDIRFFAEQPDLWINVSPGRFVIFFPEDAHLPMVSDGVIHKVVVKVLKDHP